MSAAKRHVRVVVDGSNLATEGRTEPSLTQLDEAVRAFLEENPGAEVIVVADASFAHRVPVGDRARFEESELAGEIVTPPAGAIGRGDAFILKIADRIGAVVLSNDSFQEFHGDYPWLFEEGRLVGGKPVPGVGWVFTPRLPVRGVKSVRAVKAAKRLTVELPGGKAPTIGTTLTPVAKARAAKKEATKAPAKRAPAAKEAAKASAKAPGKKAAAAKAPAKKVPPVKAPAKKEAAKAPAKKAAAAKAPVKKEAAKAPAKKAAAARVPAATPVAPTPVLRRGRQPVNPEALFDRFRASHRVGARLEGDVTTFTSHGAVVSVAVAGGVVECYAPTSGLGSPPPARARDALSRGERRTFRLVSVDVERRIAELALA
jgi:hypothetical protein